MSIEVFRPNQSCRTKPAYRMSRAEAREHVRDGKAEWLGRHSIRLLADRCRLRDLSAIAGGC